MPTHRPHPTRHVTDSHTLYVDSDGNLYGIPHLEYSRMTQCETAADLLPFLTHPEVGIRKFAERRHAFISAIKDANLQREQKIGGVIC